MARVLVVDDDPGMRDTLRRFLEGANHEVVAAESGEHAFRILERQEFDLVLTDLKMEKVSGLEVLQYVRQNAPLTEVIVMTGFGTVETAVQALRAGAFDYIQKPFREPQLLEKTNQALDRRWLRGEPAMSMKGLREKYHFDAIIGESPEMRRVLARIAKIAPTDTTVLITGESGTGKELVAKAIHVNSLRADRPYVPVNCAAITEQLLESELFGHVKGAFTGAVANRKGMMVEADGGTFFFDEIADTTPAFQAKLLRAIQDGEIRAVGDNVPVKVDVRIIAATNQDLKAQIKAKSFRQDLYYRLNVARIRLPPLRERRGDIPLLVEHFMAKFAKRSGKTIRITDEAQAFLESYEFPGNVRELENIIEQAVTIADEGLITLDDVMPETTGVFPRAKTLADVVSQAEREAIRIALREEGSMEQAAARLGLSTTTLWRKMKKLNIHRADL